VTPRCRSINTKAVIGSSVVTGIVDSLDRGR